MAENNIDLLAIERGVITAPAGCGKTHLIAEALTRYDGAKPILVLTHTNAGVVALRKQMSKKGVSPNAYCMHTIDGWAMRLISMFPQRSGHNPNLLNLSNPRTDYPSIRHFAAQLLSVGHVNEIIKASYARLIVDEYQDSSIHQHQIVSWISHVIPTCVLGDPMQAIFGFGGDRLVDWNKDVCNYFSPVGELTTPWRWVNSGAKNLGQWLLDVRDKLVKGEQIDLRLAPEGVVWKPLNGDNNRQRHFAALTRSPIANGRVLIISDSKNIQGQHKIACQTPGAVTVEAVELKDLVHFSRKFNLSSPDAMKELVNFARDTMSGVQASNFMQRIPVLQRGTARREPSKAENAALAFLRTPSYRGAVDMLQEIRNSDGVITYRPVVLSACIDALRLCSGSGDISFSDAVIKVREKSRFMGRTLPKRAVGSTLLLKGLEAEAVVILDAEKLDAKNLYVAMTRGSRLVIVCSKSPILPP